MRLAQDLDTNNQTENNEKYESNTYVNNITYTNSTQQDNFMYKPPKKDNEAVLLLYMILKVIYGVFITIYWIVALMMLSVKTSIGFIMISLWLLITLIIKAIATKHLSVGNIVGIIVSGLILVSSIIFKVIF